MNYIVSAQYLVIISVTIILHTNLEYLPGYIFQLLLVPPLLLPPQSLLVHFNPQWTPLQGILEFKKNLTSEDCHEDQMT